MAHLRVKLICWLFAELIFIHHMLNHVLRLFNGFEAERMLGWMKTHEELGCRYSLQMYGALWIGHVGLGIGYCLGVHLLAWGGWRIRNCVKKLGRSGQKDMI